MNLPDVAGVNHGMTSADRTGSDYAADRGEPRGSVVVHPARDCDYLQSHERFSRIELARRLAALKGFQFAGEYEPGRRYPAPVYLVPGQTIIGLDAARALGLAGEQDLFGGVVPYPFVGSKAITHALVEPDAYAPEGWSPAFGSRVQESVLSGYSVFTAEDAGRAAARLLDHGPVRIKLVRGIGGIGQTVISRETELDAALDGLDAAELALEGLVLEENLAEVATYSVGQVRVGDLTASYYGTQGLTRSNSGAQVYGGSDLMVVRGDFDALLARDMPEEARLAVAQARVYDAAALDCFPGLFASRRNYDIARGLNAGGWQRSGVLEQSWRPGGASGAELAALEAFRADPALQTVRASTVEIYGDSDPPPPAAIVYFRGEDERIGRITKYAMVQAHGDA